MLVELTGSHFSHIITIKVNRYSGYYIVCSLLLQQFYVDSFETKEPSHLDGSFGKFE